MKENHISHLKKLPKPNYLDRIARVLKTLEKEQACLFLASSFPAHKNTDSYFPFRQSTNFYYLTGLNETPAYLILDPTKKDPITLFVPKKDPALELWDGEILGTEKASELYKTDSVYCSSEEVTRKKWLIESLHSNKKLYTELKPQSDLTPWILKTIYQARQSQRTDNFIRTQPPHIDIADADTIIGEMRLYKDEAEIERLRLAGEISAQAMKQAISQTRPGMYEYELEAILRYEWRKTGSREPGYQPIIGTGNNACTLHYIDNNCEIQKDDMVLIDAGTEIDFYTADITRTYPANGKYSTEQKEIYQLVLDSQNAGITQAVPGNTFLDIHEAILKVLCQGLHELNFFEESPDEIFEKHLYKTFYPHTLGHWLGMDVHDCGSYYGLGTRQLKRLNPGMVFTVEPGLYINANNEEGPEKYRGIGVRIEDNILITESGHEILTRSVPKEVNEIESLMSSKEA